LIFLVGQFLINGARHSYNRLENRGKSEQKLTAEKIQSMMIGVCPDCFMGLIKETRLTSPPNAWEIRCIKCDLPPSAYLPHQKTDRVFGVKSALSPPCAWISWRPSPGVISNNADCDRTKVLIRPGQQASIEGAKPDQVRYAASNQLPPNGSSWSLVQKTVGCSRSTNRIAGKYTKRTANSSALFSGANQLRPH